jgi:acyl carrier protein
VAIMDSDFHVAGGGTAAPRPRPVTIGRGARIGHRVIILPGSHIAEGAIVEAASVVSGTIHPGAHVAGNPAVPLTSIVSTGASDDVRDLVARVFSLTDRPNVVDGPHNIPAWDSLGALQLLIEVEATFGIVLDDQALADLRSVGDLERRVNHSRRSTPSVVREVIALVFGLTDLPNAAARPQDIAGWDSLGMLELVLALESTCGISLDERHLATVRNVGDLEHLVSQLSS